MPVKDAEPLHRARAAHAPRHSQIGESSERLSSSKTAPARRPNPIASKKAYKYGASMAATSHAPAPQAIARLKFSNQASWLRIVL
jgi:hypothetical protein